MAKECAASITQAAQDASKCQLSMGKHAPSLSLLVETAGFKKIEGKEDDRTVGEGEGEKVKR